MLINRQLTVAQEYSLLRSASWAFSQSLPYAFKTDQGLLSSRAAKPGSTDQNRHSLCYKVMFVPDIQCTKDLLRVYRQLNLESVPTTFKMLAARRDNRMKDAECWESWEAMGGYTHLQRCCETFKSYHKTSDKSDHGMSMGKVKCEHSVYNCSLNRRTLISLTQASNHLYRTIRIAKTRGTKVPRKNTAFSGSICR